MAQFDVFRTKNAGLVIDCQADVLDDLKSRFVVPLRPDGDVPVISDRLNPKFDIAGQNYRMATQFARAVEVKELGRLILSLANRRLAIKSAIDMLTDGY